jgi:uncharacterized protein YqgV (UPF0045/DUF77 family)
MIVEFSIRPMRQPSGEQYVTEGTDTLDSTEKPTRADGRSRSMSAAIEGSWDQVMSVIRGCHQAHVNDHPRVVTTIVVVDDNAAGHNSGWPRMLREIAAPAPPQLGQATHGVRRIPVEFYE